MTDMNATLALCDTIVDEIEGIDEDADTLVWDRSQLDLCADSEVV